MTRRSILVTALLVTAPLTAGGCGDEAVSPAADFGSLQAAIEHERLFEPNRAFRFTLRNTGTSPIEISGARLVTDLFEPVDPAQRVFTAHPTGDPVSVQLPYGPAVCGGEGGAMAVDLAADGAAIRLGLGDASAGIRRVHEGECATAEALQAVELSFADDWQTTPDGTAAGTLAVDRLGDAEIVVDEIDPGSVVFSVEVGSPLPAADDVDLIVAATRCDAHALIESKKLFTFRVFVRIGGGERVQVQVDAEGPARDGLEALVEECTRSHG